MPKLLVTVGASGSGKTTWAEQYTTSNPNWVNINRDEIRFREYCQGTQDWSLYKFTKSKETRISEIADTEAQLAVENKKNIIISDTNINPKTREKWKQFAKDNGYEFEMKVFNCDWDTLVARHAKRPNAIPLHRVRSQYMSMLEFLGRKTYQPDIQLHKAVIVDVDGTVAQMHNRGPFDWDKVAQDLPRKEIITMVRGLYESGFRIIFLSGRDGVCYNDTFEWLKRNTGFPFELHMRAENDHRKDFVVKEELFWPLTEKWNICLAIDDRPQVLRLWEEIGVPTVNVNIKGLYGEF